MSTPHEYTHATILVEGREMAESLSGTIGVKGGVTRIKTMKRRGRIKPKNKSVEVTLSMKFMVPTSGPDFNFMTSLEEGDLVDVSVEDSLLGGEYEVTIDDISTDDDYNGEKAYTVNAGGWKK